MATRTVTATISVANPNRDGTGTLVDLATGLLSGSTVGSIVIKAQGSTTQGMIRFFYFDGVTNHLFSETPVSAVTASGTASTFTTTAYVSGLILGYNQKLRVSTEKAETFNLIATVIDQ